jgi:hypothetical protein
MLENTQGYGTSCIKGAKAGRRVRSQSGAAAESRESLTHSPWWGLGTLRVFKGRLSNAPNRSFVGAEADRFDAEPLRDCGRTDPQLEEQEPNHVPSPAQPSKSDGHEGNTFHGAAAGKLLKRPTARFELKQDWNDLGFC